MLSGRTCELYCYDRDEITTISNRYIALNVLCGSIWHPFIHLAPYVTSFGARSPGLRLRLFRNIFERRFGLTESEASIPAAYLLSGSMFLYPICGIIVDRVKRGSIVLQLMTVGSILTLFSFFWMTLPPTRTNTPWPAVVGFGTAVGFSTRGSSRFFPPLRALNLS